MASNNEEIGRTILKLAHHYRDPSELLSAIRKKHPDAKKKEITLAALAIMIEQVESDAAEEKKSTRPAKAKRAAEQGQHSPR
ncbi:hypothetical protein AB4Z40_35230 [Bosea sp. 2YAB26]|uniref:hypothetical protein n=1 Tax=Bosea sp. 2YAB26 TaxID=3237478 RepID=UPI003F92217D